MFIHHVIDTFHSHSIESKRRVLFVTINSGDIQPREKDLGLGQHNLRSEWTQVQINKRRMVRPRNFYLSASVLCCFLCSSIERSMSPLLIEKPHQPLGVILVTA